MKLREIYETLCEIFNVEGIEEDDSFQLRRQANMEATSLLLSLGAKEIGQGATSKGFLLKLPWGEVVIKTTSSWGGVDMPCGDFLACPEARIHWLRPLFAHRRFLIQPKAEIVPEETQTISDLLCELFKRHFGGEDFDTHSQNVGTFRGRLISFDIMG